MGETLSQDEIDSLLVALNSGEVTTEELRGEEKVVRNYDFRHPNKFSKEQMSFLQLIYDNFARAITSFLSAKLRLSVQISVISIEQVTYGEFTNSISAPSIMVIHDMNPLHGEGIMEIQPSLVFCMLDRLLGGCGVGTIENRTLTEIESTIIKQLTQQMLGISREAWENVIDLKPHVELIEYNPQFAQIVSPSEMVILISLAVNFADTEGTLNICLPFIVLEPILDKMSVHNWFVKGSKEDDPQQRHLLEQQIESMAVPVTVVLGRTSIVVRELLDLQVGDVVLIDRKTDEDIDVYIDVCRKFTAKPGRRNSYLAAQITDFVGKGEHHLNDHSLSQDEIDNLLKGGSTKEDVSLTDMELDTIGEFFNISMGTAATTLSDLIGKRVVITTPRITAITLSQLQNEHPLPYVVVDVQYTEGLEGKNLLVINTHDAAVIVDLMMDGDGQHPNETLDEIALSAIGEAMNQMIGSGATSISTMLKKRVNISPPSVRVLNLAEDRLVIDEDGEEDEQLLKVVFSMYIEGLVESEMMQLIPISFAKQISGHLIAEVIGDDSRQEQQGDPQNHNPDDCIRGGSGEETKEASSNDKLSMILDVPLEVFVELGRTQRTIGEVLNLGSGAIVELDKSANEPVDIFINGKAIAKGEIVAIGDNYGVRVTEILNSEERVKSL